MEIKSLLTSRFYSKGVANHLIYEWEDEFCKQLNVDLIARKRLFDNRYAYKYPEFSSFFQTSQNCFAISLNDAGCLNKKNIIPQIVDFYIAKSEFSRFYKLYSKNPIVFLSSAEVYTMLKEVGCPLNIAHLPLSLPDKYAITSNTHFQKEYDLVCVGHQNIVLERFLERYVKRHPDFIYVYRKKNSFEYITSDGQELGSVVSREDYFNLIRKARAGLYSTPGIDGGELRTKGYNQVTPRFLELLSAGCHVIARYPHNADTQYYNMSRITPNVNDYETFEMLMDYAREHDVDMSLYSDYLSKHYTSVVANEFKSKIIEI